MNDTPRVPAFDSLHEYSTGGQWVMYAHSDDRHVRFAATVSGNYVGGPEPHETVRAVAHAMYAAADLLAAAEAVLDADEPSADAARDALVAAVNKARGQVTESVG